MRLTFENSDQPQGTERSRTHSAAMRRAASTRSSGMSGTIDGASTSRSANCCNSSNSRGGTLVELGNEFAHVELVLDSNAGSLTAYVLDGEAQESHAQRRRICNTRAPARAPRHAFPVARNAFAQAGKWPAKPGQRQSCGEPRQAGPQDSRVERLARQRLRQEHSPQPASVLLMTVAAR